MYELRGPQDIFCILLYGAVTMLSLVACLYLLLRRCNMFSSTINSPKEVRRWGAAFLGVITLGHLWWSTLSLKWLANDYVLRNTVLELLDYITLIPVVAAFLLRMLQDRRRPIWPVFAAMVPVVVITLVHMTFGFGAWETFLIAYSVLFTVVFLVYYVRALMQYSRWLRDNYADLEHKELWRSFVVLVCVLTAFTIYGSNYGGLVMEYISLFSSMVLIVFVVWRVETLQQLEVDDVETAPAIDGQTAPVVGEHETDTTEEPDAEEPACQPAPNQESTVSVLINIGELLAKDCVATELYLQHDLNLAQLAAAIGTNRTYLGAWFSQQGITYNAYINSLRVEHFCRLYRETIANASNMAHSTAITAQGMAIESGFRSYSTFSAAFKKIKGQTVTAWMKGEGNG